MPVYREPGRATAEDTGCFNSEKPATGGRDRAFVPEGGNRQTVALRKMQRQMDGKHKPYRQPERYKPATQWFFWLIPLPVADPAL